MIEFGKSPSVEYTLPNKTLLPPISKSLEVIWDIDYEPLTTPLGKESIICADEEIVPGVLSPLEAIVILPLPEVTVMFEPPINEPLNIPLPSVICTDELTTPSGNNDITCCDEETTFVLSKVLSTEPLITPVPSKVLSTEPLITPSV